MDGGQRKSLLAAVTQRPFLTMIGNHAEEHDNAKTLGRLVVWTAEALDRSLPTVPDFDVDEAQMIHGWLART